MNQKNAEPKSPWPKDKARPAFAAALKKAATDLKYRDRCLASSRSAKEAITEAYGEQIPDSVEIRFYPREELEHLFIVQVPEFTGDDQTAPAPDVKEHVLCTWNQY
jgi:hypothetical protein